MHSLGARSAPRGTSVTQAHNGSSVDGEYEFFRFENVATVSVVFTTGVRRGRRAMRGTRCSGSSVSSRAGRTRRCTRRCTG
jgi:hypothetical protein